ncbi:PadR family transcriptional regulator [Kineosporia sp. J2-2]|uniref:PadR family transcriptional regulator n=1 Tax=Kineosporia corallincola TaxID=2835133 RepID=A0ABS5TNI9_9ACTN|nr:PadR family transcriptional regulator [Kineosporia corallincola]MBT0772669.1 PadR family transcriptional regulator [Kineosporia corallincola]
MAEALDISSALRRGTLEFCVLALVEHEDRYGPEIVQRLAAERLVISEGTLYPLLSRLRRSGWVNTTWQESASGPPRRYYSLAEAGRRALHDFRAEWNGFRDAVDRITGLDAR